VGNLYDFEKLATLAIQREIRKHIGLVKDFNAGVSIFRTECIPKEGRHTVTIWFEVKTPVPKFWDVKPIIIIYEGHNLYLQDICERTAEYFNDTAKMLGRRLMRQFIPETL